MVGLQSPSHISESLCPKKKGHQLLHNCPKRAVKNHLHRVFFYEKEADKISTQLKREVFGTESLELAQKNHLRYFALHIDNLADIAKSLITSCCGWIAVVILVSDCFSSWLSNTGLQVDLMFFPQIREYSLLEIALFHY